MVATNDEQMQRIAFLESAIKEMETGVRGDITINEMETAVSQELLFRTQQELARLQSNVEANMQVTQKKHENTR